MRNGNIVPFNRLQMDFLVLTVPMRNGNPTEKMRLLDILESVLTVPMRNGNARSEFLSALCPFVLTVPMRNGNIINVLFPTLIFPFLPYLWGMETFYGKTELIWNYSSYRTYEEWKPHSLYHTQTVKASSYRTYEEWKPLSLIAVSPCVIAFLPYLWGMETEEFLLHVEEFFLFLPYLWGMET